MRDAPSPLPALLDGLDAWIDEVTRPRGYLVVRPAAGLDLRPTLRTWVEALIDDGEIVVELTIGDPAAGGEDRGEALRERLAAAIEGRFPAFRDPLARPRARLAELLRRLSKEHLAPPSRRLLVLIHDLGALRQRDADDNPLPRLLPHVLPRGVFFVVSADQRADTRWLSRLGPAITRVRTSA